MDRRTKMFGVILTLTAMVAFVAGPLFDWLNNQAVTAVIERQARQLVEQNPNLEPAWAIANHDGKLTLPEAKIIIEAAGGKLPAEE
jgi:hypothetical protein